MDTSPGRSSLSLFISLSPSPLSLSLSLPLSPSPLPLSVSVFLFSSSGSYRYLSLHPPFGISQPDRSRPITLSHSGRPIYLHLHPASLSYLLFTPQLAVSLFLFPSCSLLDHFPSPICGPISHPSNSRSFKSLYPTRSN